MQRLAIALACSLAACDEPAQKPTTTRRSADPPAPEPTPEPRGCARVGALEAVERDPACALPRADDDAMRESMKRLRVSIEADPPKTVGGGTVLLRVAIENVSQADALVVLDALPPDSMPRPDWSRMVSGTDLRPRSADGPKLHVPLTTLDARDRNVDEVPIVAGTPAPPKLLGVRLRPGGKLTHVASWWAYRIPAPAPIIKDDAGHRIVPKTAPVPLTPGEYVVRLVLPLHGVSSAEATFSTRVTVESTKKPDG